MDLKENEITIVLVRKLNSAKGNGEKNIIKRET